MYVYLHNKSEQKMKKSKITPAQIRSAKLQGMTPEAFVSGVAAIKASLERGNK
jgi:hypothetical protein